ncbi:MAG TPA: cytochrome c [Chloroflexota bacterium]
MNRKLVIPVIAAAWVVAVPLTLIGIIIFGPYTHSNLAAAYQTAYIRTQQIVISMPTLYDGPGLDNTIVLSNEPVTRGGQLLVGKGCATCHGLDGEGGSVGVRLIGVDAARMRTITSTGPHGMPQFDANTLSDDDLAAIAAYLASKGGN